MKQTEPAPSANPWALLEETARVCPTALTGIDAAGRVCLWNGPAENLFGWQAAEVRGAAMPGIPEDGRARFAELLGRVMGGESIPSEETTRLHRDGQVMQIVISLSPLRGPEGDVIGAIQFVTRPFAPRAMPDWETAAEQRDLGFLEHISDAFYALDREWRFTYVNRAAERLWQRDRRDLLGHVIWEAFPTAAASPAQGVHMRAATSGRPAPFEFVSPVLGRWVEGTVYPAPEGGVAVYFRDVSVRRKSEDRLRFLSEAGEVLGASLDSRETLRSIARLAVPFVADVCLVDVLDEAGRVRRVATATAKAAGADAVRGLELALADDTEQGKSVVDEVLRSGEPLLRGAALENDSNGEPAGRERASMLMIVPLTARGRLMGALTFATIDGEARPLGEDDLLFAQEIAARAALAVDNARLYEEAHEANQAKSNFMSVMSHELRTPLTAVIGYADLLEIGIGGALTPKQHEYVNRIKRGARLQLHIVEEVLTFARVDAGRAKIVVGQLDLWQLVRDTSSLMKPSADVKRLSFTVDVPDESAIIHSDGAKLRQVVLNLLGNAVKFTRRGGITVRGRRDKDDYIVEVEDTGIGIPPEQLERIYEPFWQAEQANTRTFGGSGLGLAVVQRLVALLGGDVTVRSSAETGTTFRVILPAAPPATADAN